jgi:hypothetical protein
MKAFWVFKSTTERTPSSQNVQTILFVGTRLKELEKNQRLLLYILGVKWSVFSASTQALLPTSTHSNGFCIIRVCISSSSSSSSQQCAPSRGLAQEEGRKKGGN